jgi:hypothetical protein
MPKYAFTVSKEKFIEIMVQNFIVRGKMGII